MSDSKATRPSLLLRIRDAGDGPSWAEFAELYGPIVRGYCRRRGLQEADSADVVQEVLTQVARSIGAFDYRPARGKFRDWLGTMTRRKIARFFEVRGRQARAAGDVDPMASRGADCEDPEWSAEFHSRVLEAALGRIRGGFGGPTWEAFSRIWSDGHPAPQVARELGLTIEAVYLAKSRVLRRLREEVLSLADDFPLVPPAD